MVALITSFDVEPNVGSTTEFAIAQFLLLIVAMSLIVDLMINGKKDFK